MDKKLKLNLAIIIVCTIIMLYFSLKDNFFDIIFLIMTIKINWLLVALLLVFSGYIFDILIIKMNSKRFRPDYKFIEAAKIHFIGIFFNGVTPFASGGQVVQAYYMKKQGIDFNKGISVLTLSFITNQIVLTIFGLFALIMRFSKYTAEFDNFLNLVIFGFILNSFVIVSMFVLTLSPKIHHFVFYDLINFLHKIKLIKDPEEKRNRVEKWLNSFRKELTELLIRKRTMATMLALHTLKYTLTYMVPFFCGLALHLDLNLNDLVECIFLSSFVFNMMSLMPTPGSSLGSEGAFVLLFTPIFGSHVITAAMLLWRFVTYYLVTVIGALVFINAKETKTLKIGG